MENTPEAPAAAPAESEATPTNTNPAPAAPDMHGFTSEQLADMQKFFEANGGFDKSRISNPEPKVEETIQAEEPAQVQQPQYEQQPSRPPMGAITQEEFMARQYFDYLSHQEKYAPIAKEIAQGDVLKEMASFNISPLNKDGSINDQMVRRYLDLKVQTVPAKQSGATPEASAAPTVEYVPVGENIADLNQAYAVIRQDAQLKATGQAGHPSVAKAEEFIKNALSKK